MHEHIGRARTKSRVRQLCGIIGWAVPSWIRRPSFAVVVRHCLAVLGCHATPRVSAWRPCASEAARTVLVQTPRTRRAPQYLAALQRQGYAPASWCAERRTVRVALPLLATPLWAPGARNMRSTESILYSPCGQRLHPAVAMQQPALSARLGRRMCAVPIFASLLLLCGPRDEVRAC